ncbi:hypothetical protein A5702_02855 [Mycobacterium sp. E3339]|nr:hypothetical protein A5702_02855 [Mycobacterium sp. E3339]
MALDASRICTGFPMTAEAPAAPAPPPPSDSPPPSAPPSGKHMAKRPRIVIGVAVLAVVVTAYMLSLFGVHWLERSEGPLPPLDLSQGGGDATIVQLQVEELKPVAKHLAVNVLVYPGISAYDNRFDVLSCAGALPLG